MLPPAVLPVLYTVPLRVNVAVLVLPIFVVLATPTPDDAVPVPISSILIVPASLA